MTSQIIPTTTTTTTTTIIIAAISIILAFIVLLPPLQADEHNYEYEHQHQYDEQQQKTQSFVLRYYNNLLSTTINERKTLYRMAQFGSLLLLRTCYIQFLRPLYFIIRTMNTVTYSTHNDNSDDGSSGSTASILKERYGSWCIIIGDLDVGDLHLIREYAKTFLQRGMNVLILDCSCGSGSTGSDTCSDTRSDTRSTSNEQIKRDEIVKLFMKDLKQFVSDVTINKDETTHDGDNESCSRSIIHSCTSSSGNSCTSSSSSSSSSNSNSDKDHIPKMDILQMRDSKGTTTTKSNLYSNVIQKLGTIAKDDGIGIAVHCFTSKQTKPNNRQDPHTQQQHPEEEQQQENKKYDTETFVSILNCILPYMVFRGTGAIINISREDDNNNINKAQGVAECAFYAQLIRSLHYEYNEYGIDTLAVTISKRNGYYYYRNDNDNDDTYDRDYNFTPSTAASVIVRSSLQMLGQGDSELDEKICKYIAIGIRMGLISSS